MLQQFNPNCILGNLHTNHVFPSTLKMNNLKNTGHYHLGFDLGGTKMLAVAYNSALESIGRNRIRTNSHEGTQSVITRIIDNVNAACAEADITSSDLQSIGIGVPGAVNMQTGTVLGAVNLGWQNVELVKIMGDHFSCEIHLVNDVAPKAHQ